MDQRGEEEQHPLPLIVNFSDVEIVREESNDYKLTYKAPASLARRPIGARKKLFGKTKG